MSARRLLHHTAKEIIMPYKNSRPIDQNKSQKTPPPPGIEGEGSYSATKDYNQRTEEFLDDHDPEALGREAAEALEGDEGDELRTAEQSAKKGPQSAQNKGAPTKNASAKKPVSEQDKRSIERSEGEGMLGASNDKKSDKH
jgi:hypothetical protein